VGLLVERKESSRWSGRALAGLAILAILFHIAIFAASSSWGRQAIGDFLQIGLAALATYAVWQAARRAQGFARTFWRFQAYGLAVWAAAESLATIYDLVLQRPVNEPWPSDILFFLWMTPAFLSLFLDPYAESPRIEWTQRLDFLQVGILVVSLHVFLFEAPSHWDVHGFSYEKLELVATWLRDAALVAAFGFRSILSNERGIRSLYSRMAVFLALYALAECPYVYLQVFQRTRPGSVWDLPWTVALASATILASTSSVKIVAAPTQASTWWKRQPTYVRLALKLVPLCFPMAVLLMAAHIAEQQFAIAAAAVLSSFGCSIARILLTERKQLRSSAALEASNALLRSVFEGTGEAIYVKDAAGRYLMVNERVIRFFAKPVEKIIGKTAFELTDFETARELTKYDRQILETGESVTADFQRALGGVMRSYLITRAPYRDANRKIVGVIGISRDITEHRGIEERLRQSQKMEAVGTLAGGVAHDFNNLLMVISGYSSVLADALKSNQKLSGHVEQIRKAGERAASLTRQLLAFSRKETLQAAPLNLNDVVTNMEKLLHRLIGEHIVISTHLPMDLGAVMADSGQLEQVILNLAVNARDAMPKGGKLTIETRNTVLMQGIAQGQVQMAPGEYVELTVTDSGAGMEPAVKAHIFEPFFTTKPMGKGTGLGLSTVYGIVQQADGYITFESELGKGASFHIFLPRLRSEVKTKAAEVERMARLRGGETVLLVEDDASVCELVRAVLTSHGYSVLAARRPQEAELICRAHGQRIDLLLTDVIMPEMSGPELAKRLDGTIAPKRLLYMSGYIDDSVVRQEIQEKGTPYLQKPFSPENLIKKVREVLDEVAVE